MKRTEGKWELESDGTSLAMGGQVVATAIAPDYAGIEEQRGNAALIAAAPKLLSELNDLIGFIEKFGDLPDREAFMRVADIYIKAARAAITQATGE